MMDVERVYNYMNLLEYKRFVTAAEFKSAMEISHATFKRDLAVLRYRLDVPIIYDRDIDAYKLDSNCSKNSLPGIWFSQEEIKIIHNGCDTLNSQLHPNLKSALQLLQSKFRRIDKS
jgi:predicted DNA-binding transcriptional regulator YafY